MALACEAVLGPTTTLGEEINLLLIAGHLKAWFSHSLTSLLLQEACLDGLTVRTWTFRSFHIT